MKTLKIYLTFACAMFIAVSCGSSKTTSIENRGKSNTSISEQNTSKRSTSDERTLKDTRRTSPTSRNASRDDSKVNNMQSMYDAVDMDEDQKARYEIDWKRSVDSWAKSNPNQRMNNYERVENQDRILRDILDDSQFERYQQWTIDNAKGDD